MLSCKPFTISCCSFGGNLWICGRLTIVERPLPGAALQEALREWATSGFASIWFVLGMWKSELSTHAQPPSPKVAAFAGGRSCWRMPPFTASTIALPRASLPSPAPAASLCAAAAGAGRSLRSSTPTPPIFWFSEREASIARCIASSSCSSSSASAEPRAIGAAWLAAPEGSASGPSPATGAMRLFTCSFEPELPLVGSSEDSVRRGGPEEAAAPARAGSKVTALLALVSGACASPGRAALGLAPAAASSGASLLAAAAAPPILLPCVPGPQR
mmetsp:Transcript_52294/g.151980  ORF Transcript_52294/g.151980 Transcript_52294/m.151980 type:complete len:273 (-) Transcript_52294:93-911(-)